MPRKSLHFGEIRVLIAWPRGSHFTSQVLLSRFERSPLLTGRAPEEPSVCLSASLFVSRTGLLWTPSEVLTVRGPHFKWTPKPNFLFPVRDTFLVWEPSGTTPLSRWSHTGFPWQQLRSLETHGRVTNTWDISW